MNHKSRINLLQSELIPVKQILTLTNVALIWVLLLVIMLSLSAIKILEAKKINQQYSSIKGLNNTQKRTLVEMQNMLVNRKEDPALASELAKLKFVLKHKNLLKASLTNQDDTKVSGYAKVMTELARFHHKEIRLLSAQVSTSNISLSGITKHPEAVPHWLTNFEDASFLRGQMFANFSIVENEDKSVVFNVSTLPDEGELQ